MRATIRSLHIPRRTSGTLAEIAQQINPLPQGADGYYGRFSRSALFSLVDYVNQKLKAWIMRKYKRFRFHKTRASLFLSTGRDACFTIRDTKGQALAYVYFKDEPGRRGTALRSKAQTGEGLRSSRHSEAPAVALLALRAVTRGRRRGRASPACHCAHSARCWPKLSHYCRPYWQQQVPRDRRSCSIGRMKDHTSVSVVCGGDKMRSGLLSRDSMAYQRGSRRRNGLLRMPLS